MGTETPKEEIEVVTREEPAKEVEVEVKNEVAEEDSKLKAEEVIKIEEVVEPVKEEIAPTEEKPIEPETVKALETLKSDVEYVEVSVEELRDRLQKLNLNRR